MVASDGLGHTIKAANCHAEQTYTERCFTPKGGRGFRVWAWSDPSSTGHVANRRSEPGGWRAFPQPAMDGGEPAPPKARSGPDMRNGAARRPRMAPFSERSQALSDGSIYRGGDPIVTCELGTVNRLAAMFTRRSSGSSPRPPRAMSRSFAEGTSKPPTRRVTRSSLNGIRIPRRQP